MTRGTIALQQLMRVGAAALVTLATPTAFADASSMAATGKHIFSSQCAMCHNAVKGAGTLVGPDLYGVFGRPIGSVPGFPYSRALKHASGVWDDKTLDAFLHSPQKAHPGTAMPFGGIPSAQERAQVIAFLKTLR